MASAESRAPASYAACLPFFARQSVGGRRRASAGVGVGRDGFNRPPSCKSGAGKNGAAGAVSAGGDRSDAGPISAQAPSESSRASETRGAGCFSSSCQQPTPPTPPPRPSSSARGRLSRFTLRGTDGRHKTTPRDLRNGTFFVFFFQIATRSSAHSNEAHDKSRDRRRAMCSPRLGRSL